MLIETVKFGEIEIEEEKIIYFPDGIIGFPEYKRYVLLEEKKDSPLKFLQSTEKPGLCFVVIDPFYFYPEYEFEISDEVEVELEIEDANDVGVLCIVTIPEQIYLVSANLLAPIVLNLKKKKARQIILEGEKYTTKHYIIEELHNLGRKLKEEKEEKEELAVANSR
jgi:flagellar assembly factor FliW